METNQKSNHESPNDPITAMGDGLNPQALQKLQGMRTPLPDPETLGQALAKGDTTALSRAITLAESTQAEHQKLAQDILEYCGQQPSNSIRVGITGVPGVGKSTFIEAMGQLLTDMGHKVAVLAVDPSSSLSHGSILGDKTRMQTLSQNPNAFIRPSPAGNALGGVAQKTRESMLLCEAAGYTVILIETVGVGQSSTAVHGMVDFFLLLKLAGAGDGLQGIKRGIMEMADALVINKADGDNLKAAQLAQKEFNRALHLYPPKDNGWSPPVWLCSSVNNTGVAEIWEGISSYIAAHKEYIALLRSSQRKDWLLQALDQRLGEAFYSHPTIKAKLADTLDQVTNSQYPPYKAADELMDLFRNLGTTPD